MLEKIARNPYLGLLSGLILLVTAGYETVDTLEEFSLGAHHGVLVYSLIHFLKSLSEAREGMLKIKEARADA